VTTKPSAHGHETVLIDGQARMAAEITAPECPKLAWAYKNKYNPQECKNTPKSEREKIAVVPVPPLGDPQKLLGHPARGRK
jgi:hypothetical protein